MLFILKNIEKSPIIRFGGKLMWDDIVEFILEIVVELIDFKWNRNKKKEGVHEEISEDDIDIKKL